MPLTVDDLTPDNGSWLYPTSTMRFRVLADDAAPHIPLLQSLVDRVDSIVAFARAHVESTPYASDIADASGISADCIHIHDAQTYCIWFQLIDSPHRYLAVKFVGDSPVDVYRDHP